MDIKDYKILIVNAVKENDKQMINIIAQGLYEANEAKQLLRKRGCGWSGLNILETVKLYIEEKG